MRRPRLFGGGEMRAAEDAWDVSRGLFYGLGARLRSFINSSGFYGQKPMKYETGVTFDLARSLYRNDNVQYDLGAGLVKPAINAAAEYMGIPSVTTGEPDRDEWLNECIQKHWAPQLHEVWRDAMRDSKTVIRFRQPDVRNPLFTDEDRKHGRIEVIPPELVDLTFDPGDPDMLMRAIISHTVDFDERTEQEVHDGRPPRIKKHEINEIITPESYEFYDKTMKQMLPWGTPNPAGFVPAWPIWNEYSAELGGGQSDIEAAMPFIIALHEVFTDTLRAHKQHAIPKAMFNVHNVQAFIANNFPEAINSETGQLNPNARINWHGNEIMFFKPDEKADFIEAQSVLGDSKTLLDFLMDCVAFALETPKWALLKDDAALENAASTQRFEKKVARKRTMLGNPTIVMACKMALAANRERPVTVEVVWAEVSLQGLAAKAQSVQQIVLALDVAKTNRWIADATAVAILGSLYPEINAPEVEMELAKDNYEPPLDVPAVPAPQSKTGALPPKKPAQKAIPKTTTAASAS